MTSGRDQLLIEEIFRRRAQQLADRRTVSTQSITRPVLVFSLGLERHAIEVAELLEVLPYRGCTAVPGTPAALLGVLNVRGDIRPVIDLRRLLGIDAAESGAASYLLMVRHESGAIGIAVDALDAIRQVEASELVSAGERAATTPGSR